MSGRRSHVRFEVVQPHEGVLRVMRDVLVRNVDRRELIAISREPGVLGEAVTIDVSADRPGAGVQARVVESQPVIVDGTVRHRLRLEPTGAAS